jgi:hypothetical protein
MSDQPVARPIPTKDNTNTKETHTDINASDPSARAGEDS